MAYKRTRARSRAPSRYRRRRSYRYRRTNTSPPYRRYRRKTTTRRRSKKKMPVSKFVLAQLDPFSDKVAGVKIPDANTQPSATVVCEDEWALTVGATGTNVCGLRVMPKGTRIATSTVVDATTWTWPINYGGTTNSSKYTTIEANHNLIRPCAYGIRISCAMSPNNVTGYVHVCLVANASVSTTWPFPTTIAEMQNSPFYKRYPLATLTSRPLKVVGKIIDENAFRYVDPAFTSEEIVNNAGFIQQNGWTPILVAVTGVSSGVTAVSIEQIVHYETIPSVSSAIGTSPAAANNGQQLELGTNVSSGSSAANLEGTGDVTMSTAGSGSGTGWSLYEGIRTVYDAGGNLLENWYNTDIYQQYHNAEESARSDVRQYLTDHGLEMLLQYFGANRGNAPLLTG